MVEQAVAVGYRRFDSDVSVSLLGFGGRSNSNDGGTSSGSWVQAI